MTTFAIQAAFEYAEHTYMNRNWWYKLNETQRYVLLERVERANSYGYVRSSKCTAFHFVVRRLGIR